MRLVRVMRLVLAAALAGACVTPPPVDEPMAPDLTAMDAFWSVYATLRSDQDPADSQWAAMFETPAYRHLIEVERREPVFRRRSTPR